MNILIICSIYPSYKGQPKNEKPYVIHYHSMELAKKNRVLVVNPVQCYAGFISMLKPRNSEKIQYNRLIQLDNVDLLNIPFKKYPKIMITKVWAKTCARNVKQSMEAIGFVPDVIICEMLHPCVFIANQYRELVRQSIPMVIGLHNNDIHYLRKKTKTDFFLHLLRDDNSKVVFRSDSIRRNIASFTDIEQFRSFTYGFGLQDEYYMSFAEIAEKARKTTVNSITFIGKTDNNKRIDLVMEAFQRIEGDYKLNIIGDGPRLSQLREEALADKRIKIYGELDREQVIGILKESQIFILVSNSETFGMVYIEAMANGCVTIGTKNQGIDGIIQDGVNGFLCSTDAEEIYHTLLEAIHLPERTREKILLSAYRTALDFRLDALVHEYYQRVLQPEEKTI